MKPEEAIKVLENYIINLIEYAEVSEDSIPVQTYQTAIQALEKQVAKKPIKLLTGDGAEMIILCGKCEEEVADRWQGCPHCLTKIDWSEE